MISARSKPVVLILNDQNLIVSTLVAMLCQQGYDAVGFTSCAFAVQQSATLKPDLALIDIVVGDGNGIDAATEIRKRVPDCQILLMSGYPEAAEMLERAQAAGQSFEVLAKPIQPRELLELLRRRLSLQAARHIDIRHIPLQKLTRYNSRWSTCHLTSKLLSSAVTLRDACTLW